MSRHTQPPTGRQPTKTRVQSLLIRLDGITAGDYLAWVQDPEPPALDHWLQSVVTSAQPHGDLTRIELVWTCQPPASPSAAAIAAGFPLTLEVVEVIDTTCAADRSIVEVRTDPSSCSDPVSRRTSAECASVQPINSQRSSHDDHDNRQGHYRRNLGRLWTSAGHEVTELGRDGGDAADADVVLLAVPDEVVPDALASVTGMRGKVVLDATNRGGRRRALRTGRVPLDRRVRQSPNGRSHGQGVQPDFGNLFDQAATASSRPNNIWVGDEGARSAVEQLSRDIGIEPLNGGHLENAGIQEEFAKMLVAMVRDTGDGPLFYRFATPQNF